jgi:F-type H+-transporting ATPase subunit epsilon
MKTGVMKLKILLPTEVFLEEDVTRVVAEAENGSFCLLPRHIDFVAALPPGLLSYETRDGKEVFMAVDEGVLVKEEDQVFVSTRDAVQRPDLGMLERTVKEKFMVLDDREKTARSAMAKIEASFVRRFLEIQKHG